MDTYPWFNLSQAEICRRVGNMEQLAGIRSLEAQDGRARGTRILECWTGSGLSFSVLADRSLDIYDARFKGIPLAWISPVGCSHPSYYEPSGFGWFRSFPGGLLSTCGLDHFGPPVQDPGSSLHVEAGIPEEFGLHGRIGNLPAERITYQTEWNGNCYNLEICGRIHQTRVFGENLLLCRRILTKAGSNCLRIEDMVINEGYYSQRHMLLYHFNLGYPLIDETTRLLASVDQTVPRDKNATNGLDNWMECQKPTPGYKQQVFRHQPIMDKDGIVKVEVRNSYLGLGLRWSYEKSCFPYLLEWKMMGEGTYALGIEPCNCGGRAGPWKSEEENLPHIAPGKSIKYWIEVEVFQL